jgi:hypothetical protein
VWDKPTPKWDDGGYMGRGWGSVKSVNYKVKSGSILNGQIGNRVNQNRPRADSKKAL